MRIALISYEFPPETGFGGIGSYTRQAAAMLAARGHDVHVFAGTHEAARVERVAGAWVHRVVTESGSAFAGDVVGPLLAEHRAGAFDVAESPEWLAQGRLVARALPDLPMVVKLHTPVFLVNRLNSPELPLWFRWRATVSAWLRGRRPYFHYDAAVDEECAFSRSADEVAAPCRAIGDLVGRAWGLDPSRLSHVPYPFVPSAELLAVPADTRTEVVTFLGRLERRKGVLDLAEAIPLILARRPGTRFRFVGRAMESPEAGRDMREYLLSRLAAHAARVEFAGAVGQERLAEVFAAGDVFVFPSIWENFPVACMEAMSAARGVVASSAGGMAEQLDGGAVGRLVRPRRPRELAEQIIGLLENPAERIKLGEAARRRVLEIYTVARVGEMQEAGYARAIERQDILGLGNRISRAVVGKVHLAPN